MNMNEVLAHLASDALGETVHPNDIVNMSQSSNDVMPTCIHVSAALDIDRPAAEIAGKLLSGISLLAHACDATADTISNFTVNRERIDEMLGSAKLAQPGDNQ